VEKFIYDGLIPQKTVEETIFILPQRRAASSDARGSSLTHTARGPPYGNPRGREGVIPWGLNPPGKQGRKKAIYNLLENGGGGENWLDPQEEIWKT
jgi:hypothetical protein